MFASLTERVTPTHTALIVVDVQNDYGAPGGVSDRLARDISPVRKVLPQIQRLVSGAREAGVQVCYSLMTSLPDDPSVAWKEKRGDGLLGNICQDGSWGQEVIAEVAPSSSDWLVKKSRYSCFINTDLCDRLVAAGRTSLVFCGVATNTCVESSLRHAFQIDFFCTVAEDACAAFNQPLHEAALQNIRNRFGEVVAVSDLLDAWRR